MTVNSKMTALADEVRTLSGTTDLMGIDAMASTLHTENTNFESNLTEQNDLISQIATLVATKANPQGGVTLPILTSPASASDILSGKEAIDGAGNKITGTIATKTSSNLTASGATVTVPAGYYASQATKSVSTATQATPSISIDSNGKITASATQTAGYVSAGTKSGTKQMTTKSATTYTPGTSNQTIASGTYLTGTQTIKGDANLVAGNIKSGVSIFGIAGTYEGSGSGGGSGSSSGTVSVTVHNQSMNAVYYWDVNGAICEVAPYFTQTVNALNGVLIHAQEMGDSCSGIPNTYFPYSIRSVYIAVFLTDNGQLMCYGSMDPGA